VIGAACCTPAPSEPSLHEDLTALLAKYDVNAAAESVKVYAIKTFAGSSPACCGPSDFARSIMVEAIMNRKGRGNFTAFSAGSHPTGAVRPEALRQIEKAGLSTTEARQQIVGRVL
jgi:hypothetical protein